jgi:nucleoside-diphosphate-sugar epimerase
MSISRIGLFGAAGAIGKSIADALRARGTAYRVVGRNRPPLERNFGSDPLAEIVIWNPDNPNSVRNAAHGLHTLIYLVGVPYDQFALHPILMQKTLNGAIAEGVERVLLVGSVHPYGMSRATRVKEDHSREPHTFQGKMRKAQEDVLFEATATERIQGTILRLPDLYGPGVDKSYLHSLFQASARGGTANMPGPIDVLHDYLYMPDVGPVALDLAANSAACGQWWNLAGAGAITLRQIAEQVFAMVGLPPKVRVTGKTLLRIMGLFNPAIRELVETQYLSVNPVLMDDSALTDLLGSVRKTPYAEGFRATLDTYRQPVPTPVMETGT